MYVTDHFLHFAVEYEQGAAPRLLVDSNHDLKLDCSERATTIAHPDEPGVVFRTVVMNRDSPDPVFGSGPRRYRVHLPARPSKDGSDRYQIDLVDVPVARWEVDGRTTTWILYDGNHNGLYDRRLGDGVLIDFDGAHSVSLSPRGPNFHSYEAIIELPWGNFEVAELDPHGRRLTLSRTLVPVPPPAPIRMGDAVAPVRCALHDGSEITLGGASGRYQILYFWVSRCGACTRDMSLLRPLFDRLDPARVSLVGVSLDEDRVDYDRFVADGASDWPQCFDGKSMWDNRVARGYEVYSPSEFLLVDPQGLLVARGHGYRELEDVLRSVLPEAVPTPGSSTYRGVGGDSVCSIARDSIHLGAEIAGPSSLHSPIEFH